MPLLWVSIAFLIGLILAELLAWPVIVWPILLTIWSIFTFFEIRFLAKRTRWHKIRLMLPVPLGVLLLFCALGGWRGYYSFHPVFTTHDLAWYNDAGEFKITGWVSAPPDHRQGLARYQISVIELEDPSNPDWVHAAIKVKGVAQLQLYSSADWQYGDLLQLYGHPRTPRSDGDFNYREYLASMHIYTVIGQPTSVQKVGDGYGNPIKAGLDRARQKIKSVLFQIYPQPEAGLMAGILLGMDEDIPPSLSQAYKDTGVSHIIAISGFNMVILAGLFMWIFTRFMSPYWSALVSALVLITYAQLVDGSASVMRAMIMAIVASGGHLIGRRQEGLNALAFTAALMCAVNPLLIKDISFQLSFSATFGLVVFSRPIQDNLVNWFGRWFSEKWSERLSKPIAEYLFFTLAAQFATLPVIIHHFRRFSISSLLANPLVLPLQPAVLISGAVTAAAGLIHPILGKVCLLFSWPVVKYTNEIVKVLAKIKGGVLSIHPSISIWVLVVWGLFLVLFALRQQLSKILKSSTLLWGSFLLLCGCFTVWSIYAHQPDGKLHLHFQRNGEEVTFFLRSPQGLVWLIDPHGDTNELATGLEKELSPWDFKVDTALLTESKFASSLNLLKDDLPVNQVLLAPTAYRSENGLSFDANMHVKKLNTADKIEIEPGLTLSLIGDDPFHTGILLCYKEEYFLIPNGLDYAAISTQFADRLDGMTGLILVPADVSYIPPRVWRQLNSQIIVWADVSLSPFEEAIDLQGREGLHLISDGSNTWQAR